MGVPPDEELLPLPDEAPAPDELPPPEEELVVVLPGPMGPSLLASSPMAGSDVDPPHAIPMNAAEPPQAMSNRSRAFMSIRLL